MMQESKYAEDITRQIKDELDRRGFINEHDRLGHFESKVPLDTILALARPDSRVKIVGLQFKAPRRSRQRAHWTLTHPFHQFQLLSNRWGSFIFYALPWYFTPTESQDALHKTSFVSATGMASSHLSIISSESNLPFPFSHYLRSLTIFNTHGRSMWLYKAIATHGINVVMEALENYSEKKEAQNRYLEALCYLDEQKERYLFQCALCQNATDIAEALQFSRSDVLTYIRGLRILNFQGNDAPLIEAANKIRLSLELEYEDAFHKYLTNNDEHDFNFRLCSEWDRLHALLDMGLCQKALSEARKGLCELGFPPSWFSHDSPNCFIAYPGAYKMTRNKRTVADWSKSDRSYVQLGLTVRLIAHSTTPDTLFLDSLLTFRKLRWHSVYYEPARSETFLREVDRHYSVWPHYNWQQFIRQLEDCTIGTVLTEAVSQDISYQFKDLFPDDTDGLLIWCDFVKGVYYAIEAHRVSVDRGEPIATVTDPISAGIPPSLRAWVFKEARRRNISMYDIVTEALDRMRREIED